MITIPDLETCLIDILDEIEGTDIKLIVGGGFGIYLKTNYVQRLNRRTLLEEWPEARSTNDIDLYLRPELLIESRKLRPLSEALSRLGYRVVPGSEKYQFVKPGPQGNIVGGIKIDLLTGPQESFQGTTVLADARRARPNPSVGIHAHPVNEATTLEEGLLSVSLKRNLSSSDTRQLEVLLPHPYTFSMMKLFAFRDRFNDADKEFGRYHALDLYSIVATTTEEEWHYALSLSERHGSKPSVVEAGRIVTEFFCTLDSLGMIRLRESAYYRPELQLSEFMSALQELFLTVAGARSGGT
jgi:hypothetical protein